MPAPLRIGLVHNRYSGKGRGPDFVARLRAQAEPIEWLDIMMCSLNLQPSIPNHPKANVRQQPDRPIARPQRVVRMGCENPRERLPGGHRYAQGVRMVAYGSVRKQANPGDPTPPRVSG